MGMISSIKNMITSLKSSDSYLGSIKITNVFPTEPHFGEENLVSIWLMVNDVNAKLKVKSFMDGPRRKILSNYKKLEKTYREEYENIQTLWKKTGMLEAGKERYKELFNKSLKKIRDMSSVVKDLKQKKGKIVVDSATRKEKIKRIEEMKNQITKIDVEISDLKNKWIDELRKFKNEVNLRLNEEYKQNLNDAWAILRKYAEKKYPNSETKRADVFSRFTKFKYSWGMTISKDAKKAKEMYYFLKNYDCGAKDKTLMFNKWVKEKYEEAYNLLSCKEEFDVKLKFDVPGIDNLNKLKEDFESRIKGLLNEIKNLKKEMLKYEKFVKSSEILGEEQLKNIKDWNEAILSYQGAYRDYYNSLMECLDLANALVHSCGKILVAIENLKKIGIVSSVDQESYRKASADGKAFESKISLVQMIGKLWYFINSLYVRYMEKLHKCEEECKKIDRSNSEFKKLVSSRIKT